jgi:hypothetical protein
MLFSLAVARGNTDFPEVSNASVKSRLFSHQRIWGSTMTLKIKRIREKHGTRICLSGELRCSHLIDVRAEIEQVG